MTVIVDVVVSALVALGVTGVAYRLRASADLNLADEGYLWYGLLRTREGLVPQRDFRSYEPGRYWWLRATTALSGPGLRGLRLGVHAFYAIGLTCGLVALGLTDHSWPTVVVVAVLLGAWAHPQHKLFEPGLTLMLVLAGTGIAVQPEVATCLLGGAAVGVTAVFAVNFTLYGGAALAAVTVLATWRDADGLQAAPLLAFVAGGLAGVVPLLILFAGCRGLFATWWHWRIEVPFRHGPVPTTLPLPTPLPWRPAPLQLRGYRPVTRATVRALFFVVPAGLVAVVIWAVIDPAVVDDRPVTVVAALLGLPALHHAWGRSDVPHLAQVMAPAIVVATTVAAGEVLIQGSLTALAALATAAVVVPAHPRYQRHRRPDLFDIRRVGDDPVWMTRRSAHLVDAARSAVCGSSDGEPVLAVPMLAGLLPIVGRTSAVYDTFCVYPASVEEQAAMISSLEETVPTVAVVRNGIVDDRDDLRFSRTHPRVWCWLQENYVERSFAGLHPDDHVLVRCGRSEGPQRPAT